MDDLELNVCAAVLAEKLVGRNADKLIFDDAYWAMRSLLFHSDEENLDFWRKLAQDADEIE